MVAFGRPAPRDMTTASVVVSLDGPDRAYRIALALGAPFIVRPRPQGFDLKIAGPKKLADWGVVDHRTVAKVEPFLRPEAAARVKVGLRQLPLFDTPVNFLQPARTGCSESLGQLVREALRSTVAMLAHGGDPKTTERPRNQFKAARLVVGALTALVTRDTEPIMQVAYPRSDPRPEKVIERAVESYPKTFAWWRDAREHEREILAYLIESLGRGINYRSLDPAVLCHVYEQALVDEDARRRLGIHYTPPGLAEHLLGSLPVELIDPDSRHVLDPACGSGSLLIAAHERLLKLQPPNWVLTKRHKDLQQHLHGNDLDPFAAEIARLALLLKSQPAGNGWDIKATNTLAIDQLDPLPGIIVMNPPWRLERKGKRHQIADNFITWAANNLAPGGLLGAVVPTSWLSADNSAHTRERIRRDFEVFEIWRLPQNTFTTSSQSPSVLLARKRYGARHGGNRVVRHVWRHERDTFLGGDPPRANFVVGKTSAPLSDAMPPLRYQAATNPLKDIATILSGPQPRSGVAGRATGTPHLKEFRDIKAYSQVELLGLERFKFPDDYQGSRGASIIDKPKVLVPAAGDPGNPWRYKVALDLEGIACSNSMRGVAPKSDNEELLYALLAILGSGFANAHAASFGIDRNIPADVLKSLPVPVADDAIAHLARLGNMATSNAHDPHRLSEVLAEIEDAVWRIYAVDDDSMKHAARLFAGLEAPEGSIRYQARASKASRDKSVMRRVGAVLGVQGAEIDIWINGITTDIGVTIEVPPQMPGWLIKSGATFDVRNVECVEDIPNAQFEFQPMSWKTIHYADADALCPEL